MTTAAARDAIKARLSLVDNTFDSLIESLVSASVNRIFPTAGDPVAAQVKSITTDDYGEAIIDLSSLTTAVNFARKSEYSTGGAFHPVDRSFHHGNNLYLRGLPTTAINARIYGVKPYTITNLPTYLEQAIIWYGMAEFYDYMASNDSSYNIYSQTSGARAVDNMRDEALYYESKAKVFLNEQAQLYGS